MFFLLIVFSCLILFLIFPKQLAIYAGSGLTLWFSRVIPVLFPFMAVTGLIIYSNAAKKAEDFFKSSKIIPAICIVTGMFAGFPSGAVTVAHMLKDGKISHASAKRLFCICNNASPGFITGYVCTNVLGHPEYSLIMLITIHTCTILSEFLINAASKIYFAYAAGFTLSHTAQTYDIAACSECNHIYSGNSGIKNNNMICTDTVPSLSSVVSHSLMSACNAITMAGACITMCSIIYGFISLISSNSYINVFAAGILEMTNGVTLCPVIFKRNDICAAAACSVTAFGGICSIMQSIAVIPDGIVFPVRRYITVKILAAIMCFVLFLIIL